MNNTQEWPNRRITGLFALLALALPGCTSQAPTAEVSPESSAEPELVARITRAREIREAAAEAYRAENAESLPSTAQEVIDRYLEARGGREGFDTIQTMILRTSHHGARGALATHVRYYKKPLSYRWEQSDAPVALVTDGDGFWWAGDEGWDEIDDGTSFLASVSMDNHFVDPEAVGIVFEMVGVSAFDGHPGFEVHRIWPHGREDLLFFSAESGLLTLMRYPHRLGGEYWASYWDYRDVGGVSFPFVHITTLDYDPLPHGLMVESIELNVPLPDSLFIPPGGR